VLRATRLLLPLTLLAACHGSTANLPAPATGEPPPPKVATADVVDASEASDAGEADATPPAEVATFPLPQGPAGAACAMTRLQSVETALLAATPPAGARVTSPPWDRATPPARLDRVEQRLGLRPSELEVLRRDGFVVPERLAFDSYTLALHELYQSELPIYVSVDPILHTVFVSHDALVQRLELQRVMPLLERVLAAMAHDLPGRSSGYAPQVAADLDVYLAVAQSLLAGSVVGKNAEAARLVELANRADTMAEVTLFGRARMIDFSQYKPRGHYANSARLGRFFRAAMWLSRLELNLVSRSSRSSQPGVVPNPEETPREATDALALADLASHAGVLSDIDTIDRAWGALAGKREDVPLAELARIEQANPSRLTPEEAFPVLKAAIGARFQRTTRLHYMPEGSTVLPAIATMLGPRIVADATAAMPLGDVDERHNLTISDMAYALGHDQAKRYLAADLARFPDLSGALDKARTILQAPATGDVYAAWLGAVKTLADRPVGTVPSFMSTDAWRDLRINSSVAAYAQIKHNYVLVAGQPYSEGACEVPDGYVDPAVDTWDALLAYADTSALAFRTLDPKDEVGAQRYFARLGRIVRILRGIAADELSGRPLSPEALSFLSMIVEVHAEDIGTGYSTDYNGWYFDLFLSRPDGTTEPPPGRSEHPSMKYAGFVADYYTSSEFHTVAYAGATAPRLGVFVVDTGGPPRVVVGPVASAFELHLPLEATRLTDAQVKKGLPGEPNAPWSASYAVHPPDEPPLAMAVDATGDVTLRSTRPLGRATVTLLDHHRRPVATQTKEVGKADVVFSFPMRPNRVAQGTHATEMVHVQIGDFQTFVDLVATTDRLHRGFGGMRAPP